MYVKYYYNRLVLNTVTVPHFLEEHLPLEISVHTTALYVQIIHSTCFKMKLACQIVLWQTSIYLVCGMCAERRLPQYPPLRLPFVQNALHI